MKKIIKTLIIIIAVFFGISGTYLMLSQHQTLSQASSEFRESFTKKTGYYMHDNHQDTGLIVYTGAKVDPDAYSYLKDVKKANIFLVKSPFNIAFFNSQKANDIINENEDIENWYIGGHSLGGVVASMFAEKNEALIKGVILLGSYPSKNISTSKNEYLSIIASEDELVGNYDMHLVDLPKSAQVVQIDGGNHQQFGSYSKQNGDGKASISRKEQHKAVINNINNFIG